MRTLLQPLQFLLFLLNTVGGIAAFIWLAMLDRWDRLVYGLLAILAATMILSVLTKVCREVFDRARKLVRFGQTQKAIWLVVAGQICIYALIAAWCLWIFDRLVNPAAEDEYWAILVWSYTVAVAPWIQCAMQGHLPGGRDGAIFTTFAAEVSYIAVAAADALSEPRFPILIGIFLAIAGVCFGIQTAIAIVSLLNERGYWPR